MTAGSEVRYTKTADGIEIAYQVLGSGPLDVVVVPGLISNLDLNPETPFYGGYVRRLPRFARTIFLDRRGGGLSDRELGSGSPEDRMDDVHAVMDTAGCSRAALVAQADGGTIAALFAAAYPARVSALVLINATARRFWASDYPIGMTEDERAALGRRLEADWGTGRSMLPYTSDVVDEQVAIDLLARLERSVTNPSALARQLVSAQIIDARSALPLIEVPTLIVEFEKQSPMPAKHSQYLTDHIRGARYLKLKGGLASWDMTKQEPLFDAIEEFLTGHRPAPVDVERVLATVLFTDIVDSTRRAAELGDRRWRAILDAHDARCGAEVARFRGRIVKSTGDGLLAIFDGPARAIRCAHAIGEAARGLGMDVRAGLHAGEVEERGEDVSGLAVHIGARVAALAGAGEVLVSSTVRDLVVGSGLTFEDRGDHELRGVQGTWRLLTAQPPT